VATESSAASNPFAYIDLVWSRGSPHRSGGGGSSSRFSLGRAKKDRRRVLMLHLQNAKRKKHLNAAPRVCVYVQKAFGAGTRGSIHGGGGGGGSTPLLASRVSCPATGGVKIKKEESEGLKKGKVESARGVLPMKGRSQLHPVSRVKNKTRRREGFSARP
jgi:hypothetical protein